MNIEPFSVLSKRVYFILKLYKFSVKRDGKRFQKFIFNFTLRVKQRVLISLYRGNHFSDNYKTSNNKESLRSKKVVFN